MTQNTLDEGVIKFKFNLKKSSPIEEKQFLELEKWRAILFKMNLIGEYPTEKIGYGNISRKIESAISGDIQFIISGTQTGRFAHLNGLHYTKVTKCNLQKMSIEAMGPIAPSSESLTHFAIYQSCPQINFIFHVHSKHLWNYMLENNYPKTSKDINYGTLEMAHAAKDLIKNQQAGILAMEGHDEGIIAYGSSSEQAGKFILDTLKNSRQSPLNK